MLGHASRSRVALYLPIEVPVLPRELWSSRLNAASTWVLFIIAKKNMIVLWMRRHLLRRREKHPLIKHDLLIVAELLSRLMLPLVTACSRLLVRDHGGLARQKFMAKPMRG